ncbi:uncharacterized protein MELLADRAFT_63541 [Melampsora larici-populina 98AG31]|uniref:Uncharacterized protein n=1 Tax=Melampsora larici-populina (strain 98AG31 / pathotype 3-4-7) TaxID=747676 RepID=F4RN11_MELLP|nr:uncharacterized protein MELLADRAFT_63541 [Melampsora larici-populina 98AG31]EGG06298.1 hypothetical protein MELLADRAFT_63541 [Melampsora larici-populina 98AG31]
MFASPMDWTTPDRRPSENQMTDESPSTPHRFLQPLSPSSSDDDREPMQSMDPSIRQLANTLSMSTVEDHMNWEDSVTTYHHLDRMRFDQRARIPLITVEGRIVSYDVSSGGRNGATTTSNDVTPAGLLPGLGVGDSSIFLSASFSTQYPLSDMKKRKLSDAENDEFSSTDNNENNAQTPSLLPLPQVPGIESGPYSHCDYHQKRARRF